jgi:hypothetical protein
VVTDLAVALQLPGLEADGWQIRTRADPALRRLADRHYTDRTRGALTVGPPGRTLVLVTPCERAAWLTSWPYVTLDGLDAYRCTMFRNEGAGVSSTLILAAMLVTLEQWGPAPPDGWVTWVDTAKVAGPHPGYCFKAAGWRLDRVWRPDRRHPSLIRLRA